LLVADQLVVDLDRKPAAWPLSDTVLENLRWYLEDYLTAPFGMYEERGSLIEASLADWGRAVFRALFGSQEVRSDVHLVLRSASAALLALPWELMMVPGHARPLALEMAGISRSLPVAVEGETVPMPGGRLRVLMVISRPEGAGDVGYRMIARPLLERLETVRGSVDLVVLRPPTLEALRAELAAAEAAGRPYQIVHFDGHGSVLDGQGLLVFQRPDGSGDFVPARTVARVLGEANVPVAVLNACQSGAVGKELEAAVATTLLSAGVASVVAMAYTVYATAAAEFMTAFYNALFAGGTVSSAVAAGRRRMFDNPGRPSPKGRLPLQDWLVPVHYRRREVSFPPAPAAPPGGLPSREDVPGRVFPQGDSPAAGELDPADSVFIGRDLLFYNLETALRTQRVVVLSGSGGVGKTELARAFGRWWRDTGGVERPEWVFWHSFEPGSGSFGLDSVIDKIGIQRFGPQFTARGTGQRRDQVLEFLATHRALLVWDNFDSVRSLPDPGQASAPRYDERCAELRDFVAHLAAHGETSVLITSRTPERWLGDPRNVTALGLVWPEAVEYADHLLSPCPAAQARRGAQAFGDLMDWLDGHPLCMRLVLPRLETTEPTALLAELRRTAAGTGANPGADRTGSLEGCVSYSYAHLTENTRRLLPLLSLCQGVSDMIVLLLASGDPGISPRFAGAMADDWMLASEDANRVGLLTRAFTSGDSDYFGLFIIHPALPGYLASRWRAESPADYDAARQAASRALVVGCAARSEEAREWRSKALAVAGEPSGKTEEGSSFRQLGDAAVGREDLAAADEFYRKSLADNEQAGNREEMAIDYVHLGNAAVKARRYQDAEGWYGQALRIWQGRNDLHNSALALTALGTAAAGTGAWDKAEHYFRRSVGVAGRLGSPPVLMRMNSQMLGSIARQHGKLAEADGWFRRLLLVEEAAGNRRETAARCVDLASIAKDDGRLTDAADWYEKARDISRSLGEDAEVAGLQAEIDRARAAASDLPGGEGPGNESRTVTGMRTGPLWAALWHPVGLRGAEFLDPRARQRGAADIAIRIAAVDADRAERIAQSMTHQGWRTEALVGIAIAQAGDDADRAERTARSLPEGPRQAGALAGIAGMVAVNDPRRSRRLAAEAEAMARSLPDGYPQAETLVAVAAAVAARDPDRAEYIAQTLPGPSQSRALANVAAAVAARDPDRAARLIGAAALSARSLEDEGWRDESLAGIAVALAGADPDRAEPIARSISQEQSFPASKAEALSAVATSLVYIHPGRAARIARSITHEYLRERTLAAIAAALATSNPDGAGRIARSIMHEGWRAEVLSLLE
jgi:tetratricopeptide (TPR) repeat protein